MIIKFFRSKEFFAIYDNFIRYKINDKYVYKYNDINEEFHYNKSYNIDFTDFIREK